MTNEYCVNSDHGHDCLALEEIDPGCMTGQCPFYKSHYDNFKQEIACEARCKALGIRWKSHDEVVGIMKKAEERAERINLQKPVLAHNSTDSVRIRYGSLDEAARANGLTKLDLMDQLTTGCTVNGMWFSWE